MGAVHVNLRSDETMPTLTGSPPKLAGAERAYFVQAIRTVKQALVSSGSGWLDAEPEMALINPHIYAVNEVGDKEQKRLFAQHMTLITSFCSVCQKRVCPKEKARRCEDIKIKQNLTGPR